MIVSKSEEGTESCSFIGFVGKKLFRIKVMRGTKSYPAWYRVNKKRVKTQRDIFNDIVNLPAISQAVRERMIQKSSEHTLMHQAELQKL